MSKNEIIFTDLDLDGCCSYLIYTWFKQSKPKAITLKVSNIRERLLGWLNHNKIEDYKSKSKSKEKSIEKEIQSIDSDSIFVNSSIISPLINISLFNRVFQFFLTFFDLRFC